MTTAIIQKGMDRRVLTSDGVAKRGNPAIITSSALTFEYTRLCQMLAEKTSTRKQITSRHDGFSAKAKQSTKSKANHPNTG